MSFKFTSFFIFFQIQPGSFDCEFCGKRCKSKGGLRRHQTAKHKAAELEAEESEAGGDIGTRTILFTLQIHANNKLSNNLCYPKKRREEFYPNLVAEFPVDSQEKLLEKVKQACVFVAKDCPNIEKFFTTFYCSVVKHVQGYFPTLPLKAATLFSTTLANQLFEHAKSSCKITNSVR